MIYSVRGKLTFKESYTAVVECAGVGYKCSTTLSTLTVLPDVGQEVLLYTLLHVREDAVELFGFADKEELSCFKMLLSVSGVGPKVALSILSDITPQKFALCVASADAKTLTRSQGVGAKLAQRIVLELQDKVTKSSITSDTIKLAGTATIKGDTHFSEAVSALVVLGFSQSEAASVLAGLPEELPVEEMVKLGLKKMSFGR